MFEDNIDFDKRKNITLEEIAEYARYHSYSHAPIFIAILAEKILELEKQIQEIREVK